MGVWWWLALWLVMSVFLALMVGPFIHAGMGDEVDYESWGWQDEEGAIDVDQDSEPDSHDDRRRAG